MVLLRPIRLELMYESLFANNHPVTSYEDGKRGEAEIPAFFLNFQKSGTFSFALCISENPQADLWTLAKGVLRIS
jgi:hypothetical protein